MRRSAVLALRERLVARNDEAMVPILVLPDGEMGLQLMELLRFVSNTVLRRAVMLSRFLSKRDIKSLMFSSL